MKVQFWKVATGVMWWKFQVASSPLLLCGYGQARSGGGWGDRSFSWWQRLVVATYQILLTLSQWGPCWRSGITWEGTIWNCLPFSFPSSGRVLRESAISAEGYRDIGQEAMLCVELATLPKVGYRGELGEGWGEWGSFPTRLLRKTALGKLWNVITVWNGTKATQIEKCPITSLST